MRLAAILLAVWISGCVAPELRKAEQPAAQFVTTAHPLATRAALDMLEHGGAPIDAAIAAQMVLGLVEPQSSGIGGGALLLVWDAPRRKLSGFNGLAAAPSKATAGLTVDTDGSALKSESVSRGGRSAGVPGTLAVLKAAHERFGKLAWAELFAPAIRIAREGHPMPAYLHRILSRAGSADEHPEFLALYFGPDRKVLPVGTLIRNPEYAATLARIAQGGPSGHLAHGGASQVVAALRRGHRPSLIAEQDLLSYRAEEREPVCGPFLVYSVCVPGPPSFGGIAVLQILQMTQARAGGRFDFDDPAFVHLYAEAGKLAQADRRRYVGDPGFIQVPTAKLVDSAYLGRRALEISLGVANPRPAAGVVEEKAAHWAPDAADPVSTTTQIAIVDRVGNALSMSSTNNLNFGSRILVNGFVLNNAMTNFSPAPRPGQEVANRMQPGKRPVTSMAPTIVFDAQGVPVVVGGSGGGGQIVDYIAQGLIEMLANGRPPAEALRRGHVSTAVTGRVQLEEGSAAAALQPALAARGHAVEIAPMPSGLGFLARRGAGWIGAADPRRDGLAAGK